MSLFRYASTWTLRALALWGAIELGGALFMEASGTARALTQLSGHQAAMARLEERARSLEAAATALEARQAEAAPAAIQAATPSDLSMMLREHLLQSGAQAPVVEPSDSQIATTGPIGFVARWREPRESAPQALYALARRFPDLRGQRLKLETQGDMVQAEFAFMTSLSGSREATP